MNKVRNEFFFIQIVIKVVKYSYVFHSESTLYSCLNVKELLAQNTHNIWSLSDCNRIGTHNHLAHKQTFNHLAKLVKWLSSVVSTYLFGAFDLNFRYCTCFKQVVVWHLGKDSDKHYTHTKLGHLTRGSFERKVSNSWGSQRKSWTHFLSSFHLDNNRSKEIKS